VPPEHARLLRLAGQQRVRLTAPQGVTLAERVVYASASQPVPPDLAALLAAPAVVALHSAEAARHFAAECDRLGLARGAIALAALGPRVAEAAGDGWAALVAAATPDDGALLALADDLCHSSDGAQPERPISMQEEAPAPSFVPPRRAAAAPRSARTTLIVALIAVLVGGALAGWLVWRGDLDAVLPTREAAPAPAVPAVAPAASPVPATAAGIEANVDAMETRVAILDKRLGQLGIDADAAAGQATRAESLLIVAATRRLIEKGAPLGAGESRPRTGTRARTARGFTAMTRLLVSS